MRPSWIVYVKSDLHVQSSRTASEHQAIWAVAWVGSNALTACRGVDAARI